MYVVKRGKAKLGLSIAEMCMLKFARISFWHPRRTDVCLLYTLRSITVDIEDLSLLNKMSIVDSQCLGMHCSLRNNYEDDTGKFDFECPCTK
jgi:hypothetical protein